MLDIPIKSVALRYTDSGNFASCFSVLDGSGYNGSGKVVSIGICEGRADQYWDNGCDAEALANDYRDSAIRAAGYDPANCDYRVKFNGFVC